WVWPRSRTGSGTRPSGPSIAPSRKSSARLPRSSARRLWAGRPSPIPKSARHPPRRARPAEPPAGPCGLEVAGMDIGRVVETWRQVLAVDFLRYFLTAAPFYLVFWVWRPARVRDRRLQPTDPGRERIADEVAYSLSTVLIFSGIGLSLLYATKA